MKIRNVLFFLGFLLISHCAIAQTSLAENMVGSYKGQFRGPGMAATVENHHIKVTAVNDSTIHIEATGGSESTSFKATVTENNGIYTLKAPGNFMIHNGSFALAAKRISYTYHLGGSDPRNVEVFSGLME